MLRERIISLKPVMEKYKCLLRLIQRFYKQYPKQKKTRIYTPYFPSNHPDNSFEQYQDWRHSLGLAKNLVPRFGRPGCCSSHFFQGDRNMDCLHFWAEYSPGILFLFLLHIGWSSCPSPPIYHIDSLLHNFQGCKAPRLQHLPSTASPQIQAKCRSSSLFFFQL